MFANPTQVGTLQRVVATLVACALVMWSIGSYSTAQAANLSDVSNTLTTSEPSVTAGHTISFTLPTGSSIAPGDDIVITFDSQDDGAGGQDFAGGDIGAAIDVAADVTFGVNAPAGTAATFVAEDVDSFTFEGVTASAGDTVEIVVADGILTNPAKVAGPGIGDSYEIEIDIANATNDIGRTRVAIVETVQVTAIVPTVFDFEVRSVATSTTVNGEATTGGSSETLIPFQELVAGAPEFIAQQLAVTTNARNGFVVTVEQSGPLASANGADIDSFFDATDETTPTAWASPNGTLAFGENGWGHWGMTTEDGNTFGGPAFTAADQYIAVLNTPQIVFGHNGPSDGTTTGAGTAADDDIGVTEVGYKIEITPLQEAADDYNTTLTYIATPTF
jgi:hypothetical protein